MAHRKDDVGHVALLRNDLQPGNRFHIAYDVLYERRALATAATCADTCTTGPCRPSLLGEADFTVLGPAPVTTHPPTYELPHLDNITSIVQAQLRELNNDTAPGLDGLPAPFIKHARTVEEACCALGPAAWKVARISPRFKDTDPTDPNNTMQPMFILRHLVHAQKASADAKHRKLFTAFIDFKQAYDHIPRQQLWEHLRVGVKHEILPVVREFKYLGMHLNPNATPAFTATHMRAGMFLAMCQARKRARECMILMPCVTSSERSCFPWGCMAARATCKFWNTANLSHSDLLMRVIKEDVELGRRCQASWSAQFQLHARELMGGGTRFIRPANTKVRHSPVAVMMSGP
ncbi:hypothetical protein HaLaN_10603, partial [Haematococcus lacustris]